MPESEVEQFDRAVREGADLVMAGDRPRIAMQYLATEYDLGHRSEQLLESIAARVVDEVDAYVGPSTMSSGNAVHYDRECRYLGEDAREATAEEIALRRDCSGCSTPDVPLLEESDPV
ncbi:MAG: hypothetical protein ABEH81_04155 [Halopenitus sp.]